VSNLDAIADELYALPPQEFVAARDARVREAKTAKDAEVARAVGRLRKPSTAAWVLNLLAHRHPQQVEELARLGAALREAQSTLSGAQLRELGHTRHEVLAALADRAKRLAAEAGHFVSPAVEEEIQQTLGAALADPDAAERLREGRLTSSLTYEGFGPAVVAAPSQGGTLTRRAPEKAVRERAVRERAVRERAEQERAGQERAGQERAGQERAGQERAEQERAEQERAEREQARRERQRLKTARRDAAAAVVSAEREAARARLLAEHADRALERARQALADIDRRLAGP
jgi:hypothetical protein